MSEESLFELVLNTAASQQEALLDRECRDNLELRRRVEALLAAHAAPERLLGPGAPGDVKQTGAFEGSRATVAGATAGTVIAGKYKLLQQIGEGGMGSVWMADQTEPVKRRVAVKLIHAERGSSKTILSRFEAERQAIALMDHPHIAKLLEAGTTETGSPFFVMELVKGVRLTEYCDTQKLTIPERLNLFVQICSAVQHAHQKGIIHRDLKPSNILIESHDGKPVPKVIDFGLAKATSGMQLSEHTLFTAFGMVAGTPLYMAPEQAALNAIDVDTRADIYALGVILYELLTGTTPIERATFKKAAFDEMLRVIREQEPPTPSSRISSSESKANVASARQTEPAKLGRFVKGELDWIVMKALAKERDRRYETANGFAKDVERFLNHEPVTAGPPTVGYKLRKFVQRNKGAVVATGLVVLALVGGIAGTTYGLFRADRHWRAAELARADEAEQHRIADEEKIKAQQAEALTLADYRASTDEAIKQLISSKPELGPQERAYLENARKRWMEFADRQPDDERGRAIRAEGYYRVASLWANLGRKEEALPKFQAARDIQMKLVEQFPAVPTYQQELGRTHSGLGFLLRGLGRLEEARAEYVAACDIQKYLVEQFPAVPDHQQELANTYLRMGNLQRDFGKSARVEYEAARDIRKKLVEQFPAMPAYCQDLAKAHNNLGILLRDLGKSEAARTEYQASRDLFKKLIEQFPAMPEYRQDLLPIHQNLGGVLADLGKPEEALAEYKAARDIEQKLVEQFPAVPDHKLLLAETYNSMGKVVAALGKTEEARTEYRLARDIGKKLVEQFPAVPAYQQTLAHAHNNLGRLLADLGKPEEAQAEYKAARDIEQKLVEQFPAVPNHKRLLAETQNELGRLLRDLGKREEARTEFEAARDIWKMLVEQFPAVPAYKQKMASAQIDLGTLLADLGKPEEARAECNAARDLQKMLVEQFPTVPHHQDDLANNYNGMGYIFARLGKREEARTEYRLARDIGKRLVEQFPAVPAYQMTLAHTHSKLGSLLADLGKPEEAQAEYKAARDLFKKLIEQFPAVPNYQVQLGGSYCNSGTLVSREGKAADSLQWYNLAIQTLKPVHEKEPRDITARLFLRNSHKNRAFAYEQLQKLPEAVKDWDRIVELSPPPEQPVARARRASRQVHAGMVTEAVAEVTELSKLPGVPASVLFDFVRIYSVASDKVADKKQEYADRAMELLQKAVKAGYKDAAHMKKDTDLDSLRDREDFKKLLAELEKK